MEPQYRFGNFRSLVLISLLRKPIVLDLKGGSTRLRLWSFEKRVVNYKEQSKDAKNTVVFGFTWFSTAATGTGRILATRAQPPLDLARKAERPFWLHRRQDRQTSAGAI